MKLSSIRRGGAFISLGLLISASSRLGRRNDQSRNETSQPSLVNDGRGRQADSPAAIPPRGWKDILHRTWDGISSKNLGIVSAGTAFYSLLAIFPGLAALVAIYGLVADPSDVQRLIALGQDFLPRDASQLIDEQLKTLIQKSGGGLTLAAVMGILFALWSAHSGITTLMTALNIAYGETEKRGYVKRNAMALGLTFGAMVFLVVALGLVALLPAVIDFLPLPDSLKELLSLVRWPVLAVLILIGLAIIYRIGPSRDQPKWRWVSWGAALTTILWMGGSAGFSLYVTKFGSYDKTYGSLGAVIALLMWLYLTSYFVLIGAELNAEAEHQTAKDTTTGAPQPMGARNAEMADTLGKST